MASALNVCDLAHKMDCDFSQMSDKLAKISLDLREAEEAAERQLPTAAAVVLQANKQTANKNLDETDADSECSSCSTSAVSSLSTSSSSSQLDQSITTTANLQSPVPIAPSAPDARIKLNSYRNNNNNNNNNLNGPTDDDDDDDDDSTHANQAAGAPKRSRSLVDDAKLDTQRNKQLLEEIRREQGQLRVSLDVREDEEEQVAVAQGTGSGEQQKAQIAPEVVTERELETELETEPHLELHDEAKEAERLLSDFPRHIGDLDHCNHLLIKYEPELDPTHPGFHDLEYRARRKEVAEVAFNYKHGERIPEIAYDDKERATWRAIYLRLKEAYSKYACEQHNLAIAQLEQEAVYSPDSIPQLQQVSEFLEKKTGWRLRPVAGLLSARDFLASLAFRVFQTTQYIRHWGNPEHSVEPDCIHELMGHIPMLCDQEFAQFSQELGLASLGASDEQIEKFATLYWFTVEFGLCREHGDQLKCYGAGLLSSYGEMEHALESGKPALKEFVPEETAIETYDDSEYQVVYYVARSFQEAKFKIKQYAQAHLERKYELAYDPYTCSVKELSTYDQLESYANSIKSDMNRLCSALGKLKASANTSTGGDGTAGELAEQVVVVAGH